jgi:hypothetical protein
MKKVGLSAYFTSHHAGPVSFLGQKIRQNKRMAEKGCASGFWDIITNSADNYLEKRLAHLPSPVGEDERASLNPAVHSVLCNSDF